MKLEGMQGHKFEPVEFVIDDRLSVKNYARAVGARDESLLSRRQARAQGWPARPVPPTMYAFFLTLSEEQLLDGLGFTWGKTLAAGIRVVKGKMATEDDWVQGRSIVDDAYEKEGSDGTVRQFLKLRTEFRDEVGEFVGGWEALFIERKSEGISETLRERTGVDSMLRPSTTAQQGPQEPATVPASGALESHSTGALNSLDFARMSVALDDPNLVHLDPSVAAEAGFDGVIGSGGIVIGAMYETICSHVGRDRVLAGDTRQRLPYGLGTELITTGRFTGTTTVDSVEGPVDVAICDAEVHDSDGQLIGEGSFQVLLRQQTT